MTAFKCTKSTKLTEFQFRFLHQTLATNVSLVKMGYKDDIRCSFCHEEAENFTHLFWFCSKIELFWKHLIAFLTDRKLLSNDYLLNSLVVLGLMILLILPKTKPQLTSFCYLRDSTFGFAEAKEIFQLLKILSLF